MVDRIVTVIPSKSPINNDHVKDHVHELNLDTISTIISKVFNKTTETALDMINNANLDDISKDDLNEFKNEYRYFFYFLFFILFVYLTRRIYLERKKWISYNKQKEFLKKKAE